MQSFNPGTLALEHVAADRRPPYTIVRLGGEHDLATADSIRGALLTTTGAVVRAFTIACVTAHLTCCASVDDARRLIETDHAPPTS
jgi:hypothetical protein